MRYIILCLSFTLLTGCQNQRDSCLPKEGVALMIRNKFDYAEVIKRNYLCYDGVSTFLKIGKLLNDLAGRLIDSAGGINKDAELVDPCNRKSVITGYEKSGLAERINLEIEELNKNERFNWKDWPGVKKLLDDVFLEGNGLYFKRMLEGKPLGYAVLDLMLLENKIYSQILLDRTPCKNGEY